MSLAHFAVWYATSKAPSTFGMSSRAQPTCELQGNSGWIYLRRKQACLCGLLANHSDALATDQQGVGEVNYLASNVCAMGQRFLTDAEYHRRVDSLNESQRLGFQKVLNYTTARHEY